ncbi:formate dehydrogenase subunit gamma [Exilibacterium tricleocarpae]|uniref:NADH-quinone oxidoreductase subunit E n=1 Tax=Exilibacterium tricleocarpae TaxID=2591008 RepID=A0A545SS45_9GAMM|nr:formate dehydrogenase subunit gamma [Exilibacterium tricleocarpae]TQV67788.1 formate dehydrogenase subunit gamma [Exilibacterium tricleocarpae]
MSDSPGTDRDSAGNRDADQIDNTITEVIDTLKHQPGALLPILHGIQARLGYVPAAAVPAIARALKQTRAEIHGVISFYHDFRERPPGRHLLRLCRAEACQARGAGVLEAHVKQVLGLDYHQTTADGEFSLEPVYCLGNCACGPSLRIDNHSGSSILGRVDAERFDQLVEALTRVAVEVR